MSTTENEGFNLPSIILKDIWDMFHWGNMRVDEIKKELHKSHAVNYSVNRIKYIIKMVEGWKKDGKSMYIQYGLERKEWSSERQRPIDMIQVGSGRGFGKGIPTFASRSNVPASLIIQEKRKKKTPSDNLLIFMAADCEYCNFAKRKGFYYEALKRIKQKYDKYYHIREIITSGNPTEGLKNPETRETALYYMKEMGTTKGNFDFYFPAIRIQGNSWGVMCQYRLGIHLKLLFELVELIHTQKLLPGQKLAPPYHTGKYMEDYGLGKKGR